MKIVVHANPEQYHTLLLKGIPGNASLLTSEESDADAYFDLLFTAGNSVFQHIREKPVFVNAVTETYHGLPANFTRFNGWNTMLERPSWEVADRENPHFKNATAVLDSLGWKYNIVPDIPGMIAARVIATIVNEAYFALGEHISTKAEIDIAMKSGTNYPYGPFEWAEKIGLGNIYRLLVRMQEEDEKYAPSEALLREHRE